MKAAGDALCGCAWQITFSQADDIGPWQITLFDISGFIAYFKYI
jgi:hypothetical protein